MELKWDGTWPPPVGISVAAQIPGERVPAVVVGYGVCEGNLVVFASGSDWVFVSFENQPNLFPAPEVSFTWRPEPCEQ